MSYVITGNPGVGKHTIANELSKILHIPILDINGIAKNSGLFEPKDETNDVDVSKLKEILKTKLKKPCIIVGHLAPYVLESSDITKVIILRKNPYDLISVYEQRKYSSEKIKENSGSEALGIIAHDAISNFGSEITFQINTTQKSIDEIIIDIQDIINEKQINQEVDWLKSITKNNDLEKFFTY